MPKWILAALMMCAGCGDGAPVERSDDEGAIAAIQQRQAQRNDPAYRVALLKTQASEVFRARVLGIRQEEYGGQPWIAIRAAVVGAPMRGSAAGTVEVWMWGRLLDDGRVLATSESPAPPTSGEAIFFGARDPALPGAPLRFVGAEWASLPVGADGSITTPRGNVPLAALQTWLAGKAE